MGSTTAYNPDELKHLFFCLFSAALRSLIGESMSDISGFTKHFPNSFDWISYPSEIDIKGVQA